MTSSLRAKG